MIYEKIRTVPACKMCTTQYQFQTCLWKKEDGTTQWIYKESPAFRGQIIPHIHDVNRLEDGTVLRKHNGKREILKYTNNGTFLQHYIEGHGSFLYLVCPTIQDAVRNKAGFTYFQFFSDTSVECRDKWGELWKFSVPLRHYQIKTRTCVCEECTSFNKECKEECQRCDCGEWSCACECAEWCYYCDLHNNLCECYDYESRDD